MGNCVVYPSLLNGKVTPPPSKSLAHRAIICSGLAQGSSKICNVAFSDDIQATVNAMNALGAHIEKKDGGLSVRGLIAGVNTLPISIDCAESGSTLRFILPVALALGGNCRFTGRGNLGSRPLTPFFNIFREQNIFYRNEKDRLDLQVEGKLSSGKFELPGNISSQFISGLLIAAPLLGGNCEISVGGKLESRGYVDLTLAVMEQFGVFAQNSGDTFTVAGGQRYVPAEYEVEPDYSQAAFFLTASAVGNHVEVAGLNQNSLQGDKAVIGILERLASRKNGGREPFVIDASDCPDIIPPLALAAAVTPGTTEIINAWRLRIKECDRLSATVNELNAIGADIDEYPDKMVIRGVKKLRGGEFDSYGDHRMAMTAAVAATVCERPVTIWGSDSVTKSYPTFFDDFQKLGGRVETI